MKRIGLIGGMSWESTTEYYRLINREVAHRLGGLHSARIILSSVDFAEVSAVQVSGDWDAAGRLLAAEASGLEAAGADLVLICANTMHKVADAVEAAVTIPLLHLADATANAVRAAGITRVGLLGTAYTMEQDFYRDRLAAHGLDVITPEPADRAEVHRVIYDELCRGTVLDDSRERYLAIIDRLRDRGAEGVILGCTEIELLLDPDAPGPVPLFATTRIHALAAVDAALADDLPGFAERGRARATVDRRTAEEILGYDGDGLPG